MDASASLVCSYTHSGTLDPRRLCHGIGRRRSMGRCDQSIGLIQGPPPAAREYERLAAADSVGGPPSTGAVLPEATSGATITNAERRIGRVASRERERLGIGVLPPPRCSRVIVAA